MRIIAYAEQALQLWINRVHLRSTFGSILANKGTVMKDIANARIEIEKNRLLVYQTAKAIDLYGNKHARQYIAMIKASVPKMALKIIDQAIQHHGGIGLSQDTPLAFLYAHVRTLAIADGPTIVHQNTVAKLEYKKSKL